MTHVPFDQTRIFQINWHYHSNTILSVSIWATNKNIGVCLNNKCWWHNVSLRVDIHITTVPIKSNSDKHTIVQQFAILENDHASQCYEEMFSPVFFVQYLLSCSGYH